MRQILLLLIIVGFTTSCVFYRYETDNYDDFSKWVKPRAFHEYKRHFNKFNDASISFNLKYDENGYLESCNSVGDQNLISMESRICDYVFDTVRYTNSVKRDVKVNLVFKEKPNNYSKRTASSVADILNAEKDEIYALFNLALEGDASITGKTFVKISIRESGEAYGCSIQNSTIYNLELENKINKKICSINFGKISDDSEESADVVWTLDFIPKQNF